METFELSARQDLLHLVVGLVGIYVGKLGAGRGYNWAIGWIFILVGAFGLFTGLLARSRESIFLYLAVGIVSLAVFRSANT